MSNTPRFCIDRLPFSREEVAALTAQIKAGGVLAAPEADDETFLEVAIAARARFLVTGNGDHYPPDRRYGVDVVSPREFIDSAEIRSGM